MGDSAALLRYRSRFRAFPDRRVQKTDGTWEVPVYRVTSRNGPVIHYRVDDAGTRAQWRASAARLEANGLEILLGCIRCRHDARCDGGCAWTRVGHDPGCPWGGDTSGRGGEPAYWEKSRRG